MTHTDPAPPQSWGVYFSANDAVYDWAVAFLNSFRAHNPSLRLLLIPFNDHYDRLLRLQSRYHFEPWTDPAFAPLEAIGRAFELGHTPTGPYWFRRYAAFWGPLERFMYLDARQLVLADLTPTIAALDEYNFDFLHYDCAVDQVYAPGPLRQSLLHQGRGRGFNSGRWASRRGLFTLDEFENLAATALTQRDQLNPRNTDQAFINYCCDHQPVRYAHLAEVTGGIAHTAWARQPGAIYRQDGRYHLWDYGGQDHKKQLILLHWAGYRLDSRMPHRRLFDHYALAGRPRAEKVRWHLRHAVDALWRQPFTWVRQNRQVNAFYHRTRP